MIDQVQELTPEISEQLDESPAPETATLIVSFSDVALKQDGSFVVTVASNRCHVTQDYNEPLCNAVRDYLSGGGEFFDYAEDIIVESDPLVLARLWVDAKLKASENIVSQYRDARDLGRTSPITPEQFTELLTWRQDVREWPQATGYPAEATQPTAPGWIDAALQHGE